MHLIRRLAWIVLIVYWTSLFVLTHIPQDRIPPVGIGDKSAHFIGYFALAVFFYGTLLLSNPARRRIAWWVMGILLAYGVIDEVLQDVVGRYADVLDWLFDALGVCSAIVVIELTRALARGLSTPRHRPASSVE
jgi:VanZ family protein